MKYQLIRDMKFYHEGKLILLSKGSTYSLVTKHQIPRSMIYGQKRFEQRHKCRSVILMAEKQLRYFKIGIDVIVKL